MDSVSTTQIGVFSLNGVPVFVTPGQVLDAQRVFGATFIKDRCIWVFPAFRPFLEDVLSDFAVALPGVPLTKAAQEYVEKQHTPQEIPEDFVFVTKPYAHQLEALRFLFQRLRAALFYDCGLGKTKVVIDLLRCEKGNALVLAPATALRVWAREITIHANDEISALLLKPASKKKRLEALRSASEYDVLLLSYDTAPRYMEAILDSFSYRTIVADESHYLGDIRSNRTKAALVLAERAVRRIIVSGTPTLGNPMHLYGQLSFLGRYVPAKNYWTFQKYYLIRKPLNEKIKMVIGFKNLDMLNQKLQKVAIRKTAAECLDLPPRTIVDTLFSVDTDQKRVYNDLVKRHVTRIEDTLIQSPEHAVTRVQKLLQILSGFYIQPHPDICDNCKRVKECVTTRTQPYTSRCEIQTRPPPRRVTRFKTNGKLDALRDLLTSLLADATHKVLVWCYFLEELDMVEELLKVNDWSYTRVDGSNSKDAEPLAVRFNTDPEPRVWLAQISTGISLTLNRAAYTVYFGTGFSLGSYLQSLDRNFRIGQTQPTFVYRFNYPGSLLELVWAALEAKIDLAQTLTTRIDCLFCSKVLECLASGTEAFGKECIYSSRTSRVVAKPRLLH